MILLLKQFTAQACHRQAPFMGGGLLIKRISHVSQPLPALPLRRIGSGADGCDPMPRGQPGGSQLAELPGKVLVDQQQMHQGTLWPTHVRSEP